MYLYKGNDDAPVLEYKIMDERQDGENMYKQREASGRSSNTFMPIMIRS